MHAKVSFEKPAKLEKRRGPKQDYAPAQNVDSPRRVERCKRIRITRGREAYIQGRGVVSLQCSILQRFLGRNLPARHKELGSIISSRRLPSDDGREAALPRAFFVF